MAPILPLTVQALKVPKEYRGLHQYLIGRYADTVVLSFDQIEALIDAQLPDLAFSQAWWTTAPPAPPSVQSRTWTEANRTAVPNFSARNVVFERVWLQRTLATGRSPS